MRVTPIAPSVPARDRRPRAFISIRSRGDGVVEHKVTDTSTGESLKLPAEEAWRLHQKLNMDV